MATQDIWAQWLLHRRHAGNEAYLKQTLDYLYPIRNRVLENAALTGGETLLDVGCGDGLIAFGALERLPHGRVIFSDVSQDLLDHNRAVAEQMGVLDRTSFVCASADDLAGIPDASVDVVTLRSVLIYVKDKLGAFESFLRVLKPGGRVSLFEPIAKFSVVHPENSLWGYDVTPVVDLAAKVRSVFTAIQPPGKDPMLNFDERWLMRIAQHAGFRKIHLTFEARYESAGTPSEISVSNWENFINTAGNPRIPTLREAMQQALTPDEIERFTAHLRPLVEGSQGITQYGLAYLWAEKV